MIKLERIKLSDVVPDENNPRKKFEGLKELAASFDANGDRSGEPFVPINVVKDGGHYRIVDGERRWRAMNLAKTKECDALVAETMEDEAAMIAMIATDDKQRLTDAELSHGVQQMLLLGVDPIKIEKSAKLKKGSAKKLKKAAELAEGAEQMSIDRLLAIAECEGDEDAVKALTGCREDEWRNVMLDIERDRERRRLTESLAAAFRSHGIEVVEDYPSGYSYSAEFYDTESLEDHLSSDEAPEDAKGRVVSGWRVHATIYAKSATVEPDPEAEERKRMRDAHKDAMADGARRRLSWVAGKIARPTDELPHIAERIETDKDRFDWQFDGILRKIPKGSDIPAGPREFLKYVYDKEPTFGIASYTEDGTEYRTPACTDYTDLIDLLKLEGYEPDEIEMALYDEAKAALEAEDQEDEHQ